jgi:RimJ/RimL family protein N-acetyltransferase
VWQSAGAAGYVHGLVIDRRQGAGTGLGAHLLDWGGEQGRRAGATVLRLDCVEHNAGLRRYYARLSFREVGRREFQNGWHAVTLLEKRLA